MKTVMSFKVDKDVRDRAKKTAAKMGVPLSMVVNAGLRQFVDEERIVFQTERAYRMSKKLERKLGPIEADIKAWRNLSPALKTPEEIRRYLHNLKK